MVVSLFLCTFVSEIKNSLGDNNLNSITIMAKIMTKEQKVEFVKKMNVSKAKLDDKESKLRNNIYKQLCKATKAYTACGNEVLPLMYNVKVESLDNATENVELVNIHFNEFDILVFRYKEINSWDGGEMEFDDVSTSDLMVVLDNAIGQLDKEWETD